MNFKQKRAVNMVNRFAWLWRKFSISDNHLTKVVIQRLTVLIVVFLSFILVIGRHFDASWAGGEGFRARVSVVVVEKTDSTSDVGCELVDTTRENILPCGADEKITFGSSTLWLEHQTALVVENNREGLEALSLHGGRIVVIGPVEIRVRDLTFSTTGTMTAVNYGWLQRMDVLAIAGDVHVFDGTTDVVISEGNAMSFDALPPYDQAKDITFSTQSESVKDFYDWAH